MSKGHIFIAQNSDVNYVRQACALALSIKKHNKDYNQTCLVTNDPVPDEYRHAFDFIVPIPWGDLAKDALWKIENRWKLIYATPFKENIVYDTDMLLLNSNDHWWDYFKNHDLLFTSTVTDFRKNKITSNYYRKAFTDNMLPNLYVGTFYFKKVSLSFEYFKWLEIITANWKSFYDTHLINSKQKFSSIDVSSALAIKFMDVSEKVLIKDTFIPSFTHMKPAIQSFEKIPDKWTNVLPINFTDDCKLSVGNIIQQGIFHYVEDEFLTDDILYKLSK